MPRVVGDFLNCAIYLYPTVQCAEAGKRAGGTGFFVGIPAELPSLAGLVHIYAVTARHVITGQPSVADRPSVPGAPVIRINNIAGGFSQIPLAARDWVLDDENDLAVVAVQGLNHAIQNFGTIHVETFATEKTVQEWKIGLGDEVVMVGRYVDHEGRQRNTPTVRFGRVAMMPEEPVHHEGHAVQAFFAEMHSLGGYSGSPVMVCVPPHAPLMYFEKRPLSQKMEIGAWMLGVNVGHMPWKETVQNEDNVPYDAHVKYNSGMAIVVPAWKLRALFDRQELVMERRRTEKEVESRQQTRPDSIADQGPMTRQSFEDALKKASRKLQPPSQSDQEKS